jgi:hypothetical protein
MTVHAQVVSLHFSGCVAATVLKGDISWCGRLDLVRHLLVQVLKGYPLRIQGASNYLSFHSEYYVTSGIPSRKVKLKPRV